MPCSYTKIGRVFYAYIGHANQEIMLLFFKCHASGSITRASVRKNEPALLSRGRRTYGETGPESSVTYVSVKMCTSQGIKRS